MYLLWWNISPILVVLGQGEHAFVFYPLFLLQLSLTQTQRFRTVQASTSNGSRLVSPGMEAMYW